VTNRAKTEKAVLTPLFLVNGYGNISIHRKTELQQNSIAEEPINSDITA